VKYKEAFCLVLNRNKDPLTNWRDASGIINKVYRPVLYENVYIRDCSLKFSNKIRLVCTCILSWWLNVFLSIKTAKEDRVFCVTDVTSLRMLQRIAYKYPILWLVLRNCENWKYTSFFLTYLLFKIRSLSINHGASTSLSWNSENDQSQTRVIFLGTPLCMNCNLISFLFKNIGRYDIWWRLKWKGN